MDIDIKSWHYRWYIYWMVHGRGITPSYKENLCHYVRVLLFWAPMTWIDQHTFWNWEKLTQRVWISLIVLYFGGAIILGLTVAAVTQTTKFLMGVGSFAALLACIGLVVLSVKTMQGKRLETPGTLKLVGAYAMAKKRCICPFLTFSEKGS